MSTGKSDTIDEMALIGGLLSGDRKAAKLFFEQYGGLIRHAINTIDIRSDTVKHEDLFHGAIEHLFRDDKKALRQFRGKCALSSYLYTVCRRYALSVVKSEKHSSDWLDIDLFSGILAQPVEEDDPCYSDEEKNVLKEVLLSLNEDTKIFVKMLFLDQRSTEEIMKFFGWGSANTVYAMKNKITEKLQKAVKKKLLVKVVDDVD